MKNIILGLFLVTILSNCGGKKETTTDAEQENEQKSNELIRIKGSETARKIVMAINDFYKKTNPNSQTDYSGGGSNLGIMSMMHGDADLIVVSRDLTEEEQSIFKEKKLTIDTIAIDGLAIVVNHQNQIDNLTKQQLKEIYEGKLTNWQQVGGKNKMIKVFSRESTSGTYTLFKDKVLHNANCLATHVNMNYNEDVVTGVQGDPNSIGYVGLGYTLGNELKVLGLSDSTHTTPHKPEYASIISGDYILKRYITIIYDNSNPLLKNYVSCVHNEHIYKIINECGFIPYKSYKAQ
ncbi:MAG: substrate-binding domain-containing protein [Bacteroidota bacterium]|nr:substrate-binding domain-containing protein [Bacteroidota bacterium]